MIYFSEIKNRKVYTEENKEIGHLEDLVFQVNGTPKITKLIVRDVNKNKHIIPTLYITQGEYTYLGDPILIDDNFQSTQIEENELYVIKNLLDKQIIDLVGHKVVRVNDIALQDKGELYIAGVDVSLLGILRWLKIADVVIKACKNFNYTLQPKLLSWTDIQPLELARGKVILRKEEKKLTRVKPEDLADYLEKTNLANTGRIIRLLDSEKAAAVIGNLNTNYRSTLFQNFKPETSAKWLSFIEPTDAIDILLTLSAKKREAILALISEQKRQEIQQLLDLASVSPTGNLLTTQFLAVPATVNVKDVIYKIKKETYKYYSLNYIYVLNNQEELVGVFNLHELLLQNNDTPVYKFMLQNVVTILVNTPAQITLKKMLKYKITALPVVDKKRHLVGIMLWDDLVNLFSNKL